jgi:hypothetical protein
MATGYTYEAYLVKENGETIGYYYSMDTIKELRAELIDKVEEGQARVITRTSTATGKWWVVRIEGSRCAGRRSFAVREAENGRNW